ncbi:MAG: hypothetical protein KAS54_06390 [Dehalococcoidia bacterium]|nr:hypothetical protein [Dehalococcoidia bacterium]
MHCEARAAGCDEELRLTIIKRLPPIAMSRRNVTTKVSARDSISAYTNPLHGTFSTVASAFRGGSVALTPIDLSWSRTMSRTFDSVLNRSEGETLGVVEINKAVDSNDSN